uniref:Si:dkey-83h2.3 n=1 Tax=Cynoglossus semilaevis TaxID=244447 RepID=A0A3P8VNT0_CYNSE
MCVSRCLQCVGRSLAVLALICMLSNVLLLLPQLKIHFLLEGHRLCLGMKIYLERCSHIRLLIIFVSPCCQWNLQSLVYSCVQMLRQVLSSSLCLLMFFDPVLTSCLPVPVCCVSLSLTLYLYNRTLWSVCLQPHSVVEWNIVLFSVMGVASLLQAILCELQVFARKLVPWLPPDDLMINCKKKKSHMICDRVNTQEQPLS